MVAVAVVAVAVGVEGGDAIAVPVGGLVGVPCGVLVGIGAGVAGLVAVGVAVGGAMSRTGLQVEVAPLPPGAAPKPSWRWRALVGGVPVAGGVVSDPRAARAEGVRAWRRWRGLPAWEVRGQERRASCALRGLSAHVVPLPGGGWGCRWGWSVSDQTRRFVSGQAASWPDARAAAEAAWAEAVREWAGAAWSAVFQAGGEPGGGSDEPGAGQDAGQDAP